VYKKNIRFRKRELGKKTFLIRQGLSFELNETSVEIYNLASDGATMAEIINYFLENYDTDGLDVPKLIENEINLFIENEILLAK